MSFARSVGNKTSLFCLVAALVIVVPFVVVACGSEKEPAETTAPGQESEDGAVSTSTSSDGDVAEASPGGDAEDGSLEFDDIPQIDGYEVTGQDEMGKELNVHLMAETTEEKATQDLTAWAEGEGWSRLDLDLPNIDLVFERPDRVYPLKIGVFPRPSTGEVEVLVIMPAHGDKLGDW